MSSAFNNINQTIQSRNNALVNEQKRADTILTNTGGFSTFDKSFNQGSTFNSGKAIPILLQECYPSDFYEINLMSIIRLSAITSTPFMNINVDINFFFIPYDQIDKEFKNLMGENNEYGFSDTQIEFPKLEFDTDFEYNENDLGNYLNIPINTNFNGDSLNNIYPFLAYGKVWNEWYRDQNLQDSINITSCFNDTRSIKSSTYRSDMTFLESIIYGKGLAPTSKLPSYFTTNLPYQQKGQAIKIGGFDLKDLYITDRGYEPETLTPLKVYKTTGEAFNKASMGVFAGNQVSEVSSNVAITGKYSDMNLSLGVAAKSGTTPFNINDLRYSIVSQHLLENFALCGSRYIEQLASIWGIQIDPKSINRTENIGGINQDMIFNNVLQTSQTTSESQLGRIGTNLYNQVGSPTIRYACAQHGFIMGILTVRTPINNGGQGLPKLFKYKDMYDMFNPLFNGIGEQPTKNYELYYNAVDKSQNDKTFGWNEPFLSTKYNIDNANGFLSLKSKTSLFPIFLFGEKYDTTPLLTPDWMKYNPDIIGNTLFKTTDSTVEFYHQFVALFMYHITYTTKQPLFNSPRVDYV